MAVIISSDTYRSAITIALIIITLVYVYFKWAFNYWQRKGVEGVPASIPFGSASKLLLQKSTYGEQFKEVYEKYKAKELRYVGFYIFAKPVLVILDTTLIKSILIKDFQHFTDSGVYANEEDEPLTGHLFGLKGEKWKYERTKLTPTFTSGKMKMMFHTLMDCSKELPEIMDDIIKRGEAVDIKDVAARFTTDVIGSCAFGLDCNSLKDPESEFRKFGKQFFDIGIYDNIVRYLSLVLPDLVAALHLKFLNPELSNFIMKMVKDTVDYREKNNIKRKDFIHLLIQLKNNVQLKEDEDLANLKINDGSAKREAFTIEQMAAHSLIFFIAGFETSSNTLAFCFYELVSNQEVQDKLRAEIRSTLAKYNNIITYEGLMEMSYLDKCIQETLRKYPPLPALFRRCTETYTIPESNAVVEKGTLVFVPILGIHRDPEYYPNPQLFDPERFNAESSAMRNPFTYLPFGEGPRMCIGLRFGLMQTKVALVALLGRYKFTLNNKTKIPLVMSTRSPMMEIKDGLWLNAEKA